jgi:hypothetical protein
MRCWPGLVGNSVGSVKAGDYAVSCALSRLYRQRRGCIPRRSNVAMSFWCLDDAHADRFLAVPSGPSSAKRELRLLQQPHHRAEPPTTRRPPTSPWAQENRNPPRRSRSMSSHRTSTCSAPMAAMRPDHTPPAELTSLRAESTPSSSPMNSSIRCRRTLLYVTNSPGERPIELALMDPRPTRRDHGNKNSSTRNA